MYKAVDVVEVKVWGKRVGAVTLDTNSGFYAFEYDPAWIKKGIELAPSTMPIKQSIYVFPLLPEATYKKLPAMLADALPDKFGNALINAYLAQQGVLDSSITPLDRLAYISTRGMGALEFYPGRGPKNKKSTTVELSELVTSSRKLLEGSFDGDKETKAAIMNLIQVGTSAGGARAKAVIAWNSDTKEIRSGQVPVDEGFDYWLLKLDGVGSDSTLGTSSNYGRIEYAYHLMAKEAGIQMSDCRLLEENNRAHFMTHRFDRENGKKNHIQTLCSMAHMDFNQIGTHDYSQYFMKIMELDLGNNALEEGFRRMVFNVIAANNDDHAKNFSFMLRENGKWELSPAYDITHAYSPSSTWNSQHLMSVNGKFTNITIDDLKKMGDKFEVPRYTSVIKEVQDAVSLWKKFADEAQLPDADRIHILNDFTCQK